MRAAGGVLRSPPRMPAVSDLIATGRIDTIAGQADTAASAGDPLASVTLKQEGDKLTGSCVIENTAEAFTVTGQVVGDTVTWRCESKGPIGALFKGTINESGREMTRDGHG